MHTAFFLFCCVSGVIPEEHKALQLAAPANAVAGLVPNAAGGGLLPTPTQPLLGQVRVWAYSEARGL